MAHQRRTSRRNATVNVDAPAQLSEPDLVESDINGKPVEKDDDIAMHDIKPSEDISEGQVATDDGDDGDDGSEVEMDPEQLKAEEAFWESFREEFHEVLEQLPLFLHRQFALMHNLAEQTSQHSADLMSDIARYMNLRDKLVGVYHSPQNTAAHSAAALQPPAPPPGNPESQSTDPIPTPSGVTNSHPEDNTQAASEPSGDVPPSVSEQQVRQLVSGQDEELLSLQTLGEHPYDEAPVSWDATRTFLPRIGWLTDEIVRTSEDNISLAQTIHDVVQHHLHQLDHSIKEQERSIKWASGNHNGTHPYFLEDLNAPRRHRQAQATLTADELNEEDIPELVRDDVLKTPAKKRRGRPPAASTAQAKPNGMPTGLKITLKRPPGQGQSSSQADGAGEELYCICKRPSSGMMVMCDNEECRNGSWFHLDCLGMKEAPADDALWYCPQCAPTFAARPKTNKRRRR